MPAKVRFFPATLNSARPRARSAYAAHALLKGVWSGQVFPGANASTSSSAGPSVFSTFAASGCPAAHARSISAARSASASDGGANGKPSGHTADTDQRSASGADW